MCFVFRPDCHGKLNLPEICFCFFFVSAPFELSVGAILYPLTFLITDLITEFYGKQMANFCIRMAIGVNILVAFAIGALIISKQHLGLSLMVRHSTRYLDFIPVAFIGSIIACYIAQRIDISVYVWIRKITGDNWLWLRNNGSTAISLMIDTSIVICFMTLFGILPVEKVGTLIVNSYFFKLFFTICTTPLFYLGLLDHSTRVCYPNISQNLHKKIKLPILSLPDINFVKKSRHTAYCLCYRSM